MLVLVEVFRVVAYCLPFVFPLSIVAEIQEFSIVLNKIDQAVRVTTVILKMACGISSKDVFSSELRSSQLDLNVSVFHINLYGLLIVLWSL